MGRLGLVGGHTIMDTGFPRGAERREVATPGGSVTVHDAGSFVAIQRHDGDDYTAPHRIDHPANIGALAEAGCDRVLAVCSVGGLRRELGVGTVLVPDDFIALHLGPVGLEARDAHRVAGIDPVWRETVAGAWKAHAGIAAVDGGVYWQTIGPRLETAAEIRLIAAHADVVGMTLGSECVAASEAELPYAAICVVDNLANGIAEHPLSVEELAAGAAENRGRIAPALETVATALADLSIA